MRKTQDPLRPIYTVQLCRMRYAYDKSTTRIVSCKSNLQLACDCRVRHEECRGLLKHVLKPYDNRSDRQFYIVEIVYDFSMTRAARAIKIACDNRKQKSYRVNRPLKPYDNRSHRQFDIVEIVYDFFMTRAARATKIACDNRKQKSYRVNRPLQVLASLI